MSENITIKKENYLKAYNDGCEDIRDVLKTLCPDCFEHENSVEIHLNENEDFADEHGHQIIAHTEGEGDWDGWGGKSFWLNDFYDWKIKRVDDDLLLIPTKNNYAF